MGQTGGGDFPVDPLTLTFWSRLDGAVFSRFPISEWDQSRLAETISRGGLAQEKSSLGLLFNAGGERYSMTNFILLIGAILFHVLQLEKPPVISLSPRTNVRWRVAMGTAVSAFCKRKSMTFSYKKGLRFALLQAYRRRSFAKRARVDVPHCANSTRKAHELRHRTKGVLEQEGADQRERIRTTIINLFSTNAARHLSDIDRSDLMATQSGLQHIE